MWPRDRWAPSMHTLTPFSHHISKSRCRTSTRSKRSRTRSRFRHTPRPSPVSSRFLLTSCALIYYFSTTILHYYITTEYHSHRRTLLQFGAHYCTTTLKQDCTIPGYSTTLLHDFASQVSPAALKLFCKNAHNLGVFAYRTLASEYSVEESAPSEALSRALASEQAFAPPARFHSHHSRFYSHPARLRAHHSLLRAHHARLRSHLLSHPRLRRARRSRARFRLSRHSHQVHSVFTPLHISIHTSFHTYVRICAHPLIYFHFHSHLCSHLLTLKTAPCEALSRSLSSEQAR